MSSSKPTTNPTDVDSSQGTRNLTGHTTERTDTHGNIIASDDPTTASSASAANKLKGDVQGAIHGSIGSVQAATGATIRNKAMEEKGLEKMSEEDHRLGAKRGVPPVGMGQRNTEVNAEEARKGV